MQFSVLRLIFKTHLTDFNQCSPKFYFKWIQLASMKGQPCSPLCYCLEHMINTPIQLSCLYSLRGKSSEPW